MRNSISNILINYLNKLNNEIDIFVDIRNDLNNIYIFRNELQINKNIAVLFDEHIISKHLLYHLNYTEFFEATVFDIKKLRINKQNTVLLTDIL